MPYDGHPCAGHLELQSQTKALEGWVHRPVYGAPALDFSSQVIAQKCLKLETPALASAMEQNNRNDDSKKARVSNNGPTTAADSLLLDESPNFNVQ
jgi:hypothetical protein